MHTHYRSQFGVTLEMKSGKDGYFAVSPAYTYGKIA